MKPCFVIPGMSSSLLFCINIHQSSATINISISNRYIKQSSLKFLPMKSPTRLQNDQEYFYYSHKKWDAVGTGISTNQRSFNEHEILCDN